MAKEAKVIYCDRDKLKHAIHAFVNEYGIIGMSITDFNIMLERNRVDAVPVVRCKDCEYAYMTYDGECKYCDVWEAEGEMYLDGDFYCAFGKRKEDETND